MFSEAIIIIEDPKKFERENKRQFLEQRSELFTKPRQVVAGNQTSFLNPATPS